MDEKMKDKIMAWLLERSHLEPKLWLKPNSVDSHYYGLTTEWKDGCGWRTVEVQFWSAEPRGHNISVFVLDAGGEQALSISLHEGLDLLMSSVQKSESPIWLAYLDGSEVSTVFIDSKDSYEKLAIECDLHTGEK